MNHPARIAILSCMFASAPAFAQERLLTAADLPARQQAAAALEAALGTDDQADRAAEQTRFAALRGVAAMVAQNLPDGSQAQTRLLESLRRADAFLQDHGAAHARRELHLEADALRSDLVFEPFAEAPLPAGFPTFAGIDEVEIRDYPGYRMARTPLPRAGEMGAFWVLFDHIKSREIAMTTPVQMDYAEGADETKQSTMAFLYGAPELGPTGAAGRAEVVDVPPTTVLSIGARGRERESRVLELRERLDAWLASQDTFVACGPMRLLTHNSPMVRGDRRYFEVQLPIRRAAVATHGATALDGGNDAAARLAR